MIDKALTEIQKQKKNLESQFVQFDLPLDGLFASSASP